MNFRQDDLTHLIESLDRAIGQLSAAKQCLEQQERGALHLIVNGASMSAYARKLAVRMAQSVLPDEGRADEPR
jgi:ABC-type enterochelin transport system substrate-binding protein